MTPRIVYRGRWGIYNGSWTNYLTKQQATLLLHMAFKPPGHMMTAATALDILWPDADRMPDYWDKALRVIIAQLRKNCAGMGLRVVNRNSFGWGLEYEH